MNKPIIFFLFLMTLMGMFVGFTAYMTDDDPILYIAFLSFFPVSIIFVGILLNNTTNDLFSPLYLILYLLVIGVFTKTLYIIFTDADIAKAVVLDGRPIEILVGGLYATIIGTLSLLLGYSLPVKKRISSTNTRLDIDINTRVIFYILITSLIISSILLILFFIEMDMVSQITQGKVFVKRLHADSVGDSGRGSSLTYLRWGAQTLPQVVVIVMITLSFLYKKRFRRLYRILIWLLAIISIAIPLFTSARLEMAYFFILIIMVKHYYSKPIPLNKLLIFGSLAIVILALLGQVRTSQSIHDKTKLESQNIVEIVIDKVFSRAYFMDIGKISVIVDSVPEKNNYLYGDSFLLFLYAPIPRTIWKEKPVVRISKFVGDEIYYRPDPSGIPPGFIGELYLNFGYPGIIAGMIMFGFILKYIYKKKRYKETGLTKLWYIFLSLILTLTLLSGDLTIAISQFVRYGLILFVLSFILRKNLELKK